MKRAFAALGAIVLIIVAAGLTANAAYPTGSPGTNGPVFSQVPQINLTSPRVVYPSYADTSPPLRTIKPSPPSRSQKFGIIERENFRLPKGRVPQFVGIDPVVQRAFGPLVMPTPMLTFEGYNQQDNFNNNNGLGVLPPDTEGDVGPNHYFQWNNIGIRIFNKSGATVFGPVNGNTLFSGMPGTCAAQNDGDPIVLYDPLANRWLASQFSVAAAPSGPSYECIAISTTADPTGSYHRYEFMTSPVTDTLVFEDYPHFGVWPEAYYMTTNEFRGAMFSGAGNFAFDRVKMLAGDPSATMQYFHLDPPYGGMLPSDLDGSTPPPTGSPNYFIEVDDNNGGFPQDQLSIFKFKADFANPANSRFMGPFTVPVAQFDPDLCTASRGACVPQPNNAPRLEGITDRLMYRLAYRNFGTHESLVVNHTVDADGMGTAAPRWYELRGLNGGVGTPAIHQQGTYAPDSNHRWMGSIAMDRDGNMALGYSISNNTNLVPSIRYTGRLASDPPGMMGQGEATFFPGGGVQTNAMSPRWGDYSMMSVDPTDDCTFWYTQEYYAATSSGTWTTRIGKFKFPTCGGGAGATPSPSVAVTTTATPGIATATPGGGGATATPGPQNPCILPGVTVVTDPAGDQNGGPSANQNLDLLSVSLAEPFAGGAENVVFTIKVTTLSTIPPSANYRAEFSGTLRYFVRANTSATGAFTYDYGTISGTMLTRLGDADMGTNSPDGTITITLAKSKIGNPTPGQMLTSIDGVTSQQVGVLLLAIDQTANNGTGSRMYTIVGNASCQGVVTATPSVTSVATGTPTRTAVVTGTATTGLTGTPTLALTGTATRTAQVTTTGLPTTTATFGVTGTATVTLVPTSTLATATRTSVPTSILPTITSQPILTNTPTSIATSTVVAPTITGTSLVPSTTATRTGTVIVPSVTIAPSTVPATRTGTVIAPSVTVAPPSVTAAPPSVTAAPPSVTAAPSFTSVPTVSTATMAATMAATVGTSTVTVAPTNTATSVAATGTIIATSTVAVTPTVCPLQFTDVPPTNTFYTFVRCLACRGILGGYNDGTFRPNNQVTRGQLSKIVSNSAGFSEPAGAQIFEDVSSTNTFYEWINRLSRRGIIGGYPCGSPGEPCGTGNRPYFRPFANATRGQISKIVSNAAGFSEPVSGQFFEDVPPTNPFYEWIQRLASRGIMGGYPCGGPGEPCVPPANRPYFRWAADSTRGQTAKIVAGAFFPNCQTPAGR